MTVETVSQLIEGAENGEEVLVRLEEVDMPYVDLSEEYHYFNVRIPVNGGYIRIYESDGKFHVQKVRGGCF